MVATNRGSRKFDEPSQRRTVGTAVLVGAFSTSNLFVPAPYAAVSLLLFVPVVLAALLVLLSKSQAHRPDARGAIFVIAVAGLPGLIAPSLTGYAESKPLGLISGLLLAVAATSAAATARRRLALAWTMLVLGFMTSLAVVVLGTADATSARVSYLGLSPLGTGRMAALGLLLAVALRPHTRTTGRVGLLAVALVCLYAAVQSGSRGPLVATATAVLATTFFLSTKYSRSSRVAKVVYAGAFAATAAVLAVRTASADNLARLQLIDSSGRLDLWQVTLEESARNPLGVGWGNFGAVVDLPTIFYINAGNRQYPHNFILEGLIEGGWLAGTVLVGVAILSFQRVWQAATADPTYKTLGAIWIFAVVNASVSGDLTGNRLLWLALGIGLAAHASTPRARRSSSASNPVRVPSPRSDHPGAGQSRPK